MTYLVGETKQQGAFLAPHDFSLVRGLGAGQTYHREAGASVSNQSSETQFPSLQTRRVSSD